MGNLSLKFLFALDKMSGFMHFSNKVNDLFGIRCTEREVQRTFLLFPSRIYANTALFCNNFSADFGKGFPF